jgi:mannosyltransferase
MLVLLQRLSSPVKHVYHMLVTYWKVVAVLAVINVVEIYFHIQDYKITRPSTNLDPPFYTGCQIPILNTTARANATMMMLARDSDVDGAVASVKSIQEQFNDHFRYPWVFLNDEHFSGEFMKEVTSAVGGNAEVSFHSIPKDMWGFPEWIDQERARRAMDDMERRKIYNAGKESYHHMCRFQSGFVNGTLPPMVYDNSVS